MWPIEGLGGAAAWDFPIISVSHSGVGIHLKKTIVLKDKNEKIIMQIVQIKTKIFIASKSKLMI